MNIYKVCLKKICRLDPAIMSQLMAHHERRKNYDIELGERPRIRDAARIRETRIVFCRDRIKSSRIESSDFFTYVFASLNPFFFSPFSLFLSFHLLRLFALDRAVLWTVTESMSVIPKMFPTSIHASFNKYIFQQPSLELGFNKGVSCYVIPL